MRGQSATGIVVNVTPRKISLPAVASMNEAFRGLPLLDPWKVRSSIVKENSVGMVSSGVRVKRLVDSMGATSFTTSTTGVYVSPLLTPPVRRVASLMLMVVVVVSAEWGIYFGLESPPL